MDSYVSTSLKGILRNCFIYLLMSVEKIMVSTTDRDLNHLLNNRWGWMGGAMVLGKPSVPGRPTIWIIVGQGPIALAVGALGVVWTFLLSSILSLLFLPLSGRRPDID